MLEPTNVTYGSLREFKLHLSNHEEMEGPLGQILCEMKDFARAEYKLLCFGAFFAIDNLLRGRRVSNILLEDWARNTSGKTPRRYVTGFFPFFGKIFYP